MYTFSEHALERVRERLTISPDWALSLLEKSSVEVVCYKDSPRRHRVFWSIPDEGAFVAVVNRGTGEVITIYPARRENLSRSILTDTEPATGVIHTAYVNSRTMREAMTLVGISPRTRNTPRAFDMIFVARFLTRDGQAKTKTIGRMSEGTDIDDALPGVIEKAVGMSAEKGWLGLTIELRQRDSIYILDEWVLDESVSYGMGG